MPGTYLVIGGAGRTGRRAAGLLARDGRDVIIASRHPRAARARTTTVDLSRDLDPALLDRVDGVLVSVEPPTDTPGAEALLHHGVARLARLAAASRAPVVLISQIYVTRPGEYPEMAEIIRARAAGERALRDSGARYTVLRPSWLTERPAAGVLLEQGDTGDGQVSRDTVASAAAAALLAPEADGKTFELYDGDQQGDWPALFARLRPDTDSVPPRQPT
jgi:uncharacterized protein YbjT (DUF2867 family)